MTPEQLQKAIANFQETGKLIALPEPQHKFYDPGLAHGDKADVTFKNEYLAEWPSDSQASGVHQPLAINWPKLKTGFDQGSASNSQQTTLKAVGIDVAKEQQLMAAEAAAQQAMALKYIQLKQMPESSKHEVGNWNVLPIPKHEPSSAEWPSNSPHQLIGATFPETSLSEAEAAAAAKSYTAVMPGLGQFVGQPDIAAVKDQTIDDLEKLCTGLGMTDIDHVGKLCTDLGMKANLPNPPGIRTTFAFHKLDSLLQGPWSQEAEAEAQRWLQECMQPLDHDQRAVTWYSDVLFKVLEQYLDFCRQSVQVPYIKLVKDIVVCDMRQTCPSDTAIVKHSADMAEIRRIGMGAWMGTVLGDYSRDLVQHMDKLARERRSSVFHDRFQLYLLRDGDQVEVHATAIYFFASWPGMPPVPPPKDGLLEKLGRRHRRALDPAL
jgi:hypothetical protein